MEKGKGKKLKKMEIGGHVNENDSDIGQKMEAAIHRLRELKREVVELRRRCEELRQTQWKVEPQLVKDESEHCDNVRRCDKCRHVLDPDQEVVIKDSNGVERIHYDRECFQKLFKRVR